MSKKHDFHTCSCDGCQMLLLAFVDPGTSAGLARTEILNELLDMYYEDAVSASDVVAFEATNEISRELYDVVRARRFGKAERAGAAA